MASGSPGARFGMRQSSGIKPWRPHESGHLYPLLDARNQQIRRQAGLRPKPGGAGRAATRFYPVPRLDACESLFGPRERPQVEPSGLEGADGRASQREFDTVLMWSLDRFSREGIGKTFSHLKRWM